MTAHQRRILARRRAYCRALAHANRALTFEDCEDVFAEALERDASTLPEDLTAAEAHHWFSRRLQQRAIDFIRHRDGRRDPEKAMRLRVVPLDTPIGDGTSTLEAVLPAGDGDASEDLEAREEREQATLVARMAMERLKPVEQRLLKLRVELPEASMQDLGGMLGLTVDQASYRLAVAMRKFRKALSSGRLGPDCDEARGALRLGRDNAEAIAFARAQAHAAGCWMCRAWQLERTAMAWLPFPAFTKLEWLAARLEARLRPLAPVPETTAGAAAAGGASLTLGADKLAALCGTGAVAATICAGALTWPGMAPPRENPKRPKPTPTPERVALTRATPTPTPTPRPKPRRDPTGNGTRAAERRPTGRVETDTREVEAPQPAGAPAGATEFQPTGAGSAATSPPADAPAAGGGEFLP